MLAAENNLTIVRIEYLVDFAGTDGSGLVVTEPAPEAAVYAVDETGVVRADAEPVDELTPDPLETGTLLACF